VATAVSASSCHLTTTVFYQERRQTVATAVSASSCHLTKHVFFIKRRRNVATAVRKSWYYSAQSWETAPSFHLTAPDDCLKLRPNVAPAVSASSFHLTAPDDCLKLRRNIATAVSKSSCCSA